MMKKSLPQAIALAASLGMAASAHAVNVNSDGLGQALLYPLYTTESGNDTYIHVTNTTDAFKAVKVRFLEGMNSQEVIDFNLYLSPQDVWTGAVVRTATGAKLVTGDTSCTVPAIPANGIEFRNFQYQNETAHGTPAQVAQDYANGKGGPQGTERTRVGHLEIIEMGEVDPTFVLTGTTTAFQAIKHVNGVPGNCGALRTAWNTGGVWFADATQGILPATGGLYGVGTLINVEAGTEIGYDATAIDNFWAVGTSSHTNPGSLLPALDQAQPVATFKNGVQDAYLDGIDAVSAVLMKESIKNDYAVGAGLNAQTDWVITFPTKAAYVVGADVALNESRPFTSAWTSAAVGGVAGSACEAIGISYYDREEGVEVPDDLDFSPRPPSGPATQLCYETNILSINNSDVLGGEFVRTNLNLANGFETGWINIDFRNAAADQRSIEGLAPEVVEGLPVIGFSVVQIQNGNVGGLLANYAGSWDHKAVTSQDITP